MMGWFNLRFRFQLWLVQSWPFRALARLRSLTPKERQADSEELARINAHLPQHVREEARRLLRHYPSAWDLDCAHEGAPQH